jgi:hypothetical protein
VPRWIRICLIYTSSARTGTQRCVPPAQSEQREKNNSLAGVSLLYRRRRRANQGKKNQRTQEHLAYQRPREYVRLDFRISESSLIAPGLGLFGRVLSSKTSVIGSNCSADKFSSVW